MTDPMRKARLAYLKMLRQCATREDEEGNPVMVLNSSQVEALAHLRAMPATKADPEIDQLDTKRARNARKRARRSR